MSILTKLFIFTETTQSAGIATDAWLQTVTSNFMEQHTNIERNISRPIMLVLGLCFLLVFGIIQIQNNSIDHVEKEYLKGKKRKYSGAITNLLKERNTPRYRDVKLSDNTVRNIPLHIYLELDVGDSIVKRENSDSIIYVKKNGKRIYDDINKFQREKYLKLLGKR